MDRIKRHQRNDRWFNTPSGSRIVWLYAFRDVLLSKGERSVKLRLTKQFKTRLITTCLKGLIHFRPGRPKAERMTFYARCHTLATRSPATGSVESLHVLTNLVAVSHFGRRFRTYFFVGRSTTGSLDLSKTQVEQVLRRGRKKCVSNRVFDCGNGHCSVAICSH